VASGRQANSTASHELRTLLHPTCLERGGDSPPISLVASAPLQGVACGTDTGREASQAEPSRLPLHDLAMLVDRLFAKKCKMEYEYENLSGQDQYRARVVLTKEGQIKEELGWSVACGSKLKAKRAAAELALHILDFYRCRSLCGRIESATQPPASASPASAVSMDRGMLRETEDNEHIPQDPGAVPPARVSGDAIFASPPLPRAGIEGEGGGSGGIQDIWLRTCAPRAAAAERAMQHQLGHMRNCNSDLPQDPPPLSPLTVADKQALHLYAAN
jgi:hypothetical protein